MKRRYRNLIKSTLPGQLFLLVKLNIHRRKWIRKNKHNQTLPMNVFDIATVKVGKHTYGELNIISFASNSSLTIGNYVSIAEGVYFLLDVEHSIHHISTYPFRVKLLQECKSESFSKGDIIVEDDTWIGYGAIIMSGVKVGRGAVIAAGAVVTKDVPSYAIVAGVPARVVKYRFSDIVQSSLKKMDYEELSEQKISENIDLLYTPLNEDNVNNIMERLLK